MKNLMATTKAALMEKSLKYLDLALKRYELYQTIVKDNLDLRTKIVNSLDLAIKINFDNHKLKKYNDWNEIDLHEWWYSFQQKKKENLLSPNFLALEKAVKERLDSRLDRLKEFVELFEEKVFHQLFEVENGNPEGMIERYLDVGRKTKIFHLDQNFAERTYDLYMNILYIISRNSRLVVNFLKTVCVNYSTRFSLFLKCPKPCYLEYILFHSKAMQFDLWGASQKPGILGDYYNAVGAYALTGQLEHIKVAVQFGMTFAFSRSLYIAFCKLFCKIRIDDELIAVDGTTKVFNECSYQGRLLFQLLTLIGLLRKRNWNNTTTIECLPIIWMTISDPFVTPTELYLSMKTLFKKEQLHSLQSLCDTYRDSGIFGDEDFFVSTPRSLKHQCRCQIRDVLTRSYRLPDGIDLLDIPLGLKKYLQLKF